jgi:ABC-type transport system involved in multi-copper enzyme maturation permease subunit
MPSEREGRRANARMAIITIAGLTLKEAVRRRTLVGALLLGLLVLGLSCILFFIKARLQARIDIGKLKPDEAWGEFYPAARSVVTVLCMAAIKGLGGLFALLMAGGAISGEIDRGVLAVILPKPIPRWQILLGKWLGMNVVLIGSVMLWTVFAWGSLTYQTRMDKPHTDLTPMLQAGMISTLFPILFMTVTLTLSTFAQRVFGTSLAVSLVALAWFDGILDSIATLYDVDILHNLAKFAGLVVPQGYISWWVFETMENGKIITETGPFGRIGSSPRLLQDWGILHDMPNLEFWYVGFYVLIVFLIGVFIFHRRDV